MTDDAHAFKQGILLLAETIGHSHLSNKLGIEKTKSYSYRLTEQLHTLCLDHSAEIFKLAGSSAIFFFENEETFLNFVMELRELAMSRVLDVAEFPAKIRMWGHCGRFSSEFIKKYMTLFNGVKGIDAFRMDKYADKYDVVISGEIPTSLTKLFLNHDIDALKQGKEKLKGFDEEHTLYKLVFSEKDTTLLSQKMAELEINTRKIPFLGNLYPAMSMGKDLINLNVRRGIEDLAFQSFKMNSQSHFMEENVFSIDLRKNSFYRAWKEHFDPLDIHGLYKNFRWGIILGLAGSGKTTLLKYIAFRELRHNHEMKKNEEHRLVLSLQCRHMLGFDLWHCLRYGDKKKEMQPVGQIERPFNLETVLNYLTFCFLFKSSYPDFDGDQLIVVERLVQKAYCRGKLTVLLDALDETRGESSRITLGKKEKLVECLKLLFTETKEEARQYNRFYLTSRYSELERYFSGKNESAFQPLFEIQPLDMEQLRDMAKYVYGEETSLYREFDQAVWSEELTGKMGGTPMITSLALDCFKRSGQLDTQYHMYDSIFTQILARIFNPLEDKKNTSQIYDALGLMAFNMIDICKVLDEEDITGIFQQVVKNSQGQGLSHKEAMQLVQRLVEDGLLLEGAPMEYVFSHSTVMEYLAAHFLVKKLENHNYMDLYLSFPEFELNLKERDISFYQSIILPMAVGSGIHTGTWLLHFMKSRAHGGEHDVDRLLFFRLALKALSEFEWFIYCHNQDEPAATPLPLPVLEPKVEVEYVHQAVEWIYQSLHRLLLSTDKALLKRGIDTYKNISRLCQPVLLHHYLDYQTFTDTDSETLELRQQLLALIINDKLIEAWRITHLHAGTSYNRCDVPPTGNEIMGQVENGEETEGLKDRVDSPHTLDTQQYHREDKNFNYYRGLMGDILLGFMGSPNLRHSAHVNCVVVTPDGRYILSGSTDHTIKCWQLSTGKEVHTFSGHTNIVTSLTVSPDGRFLFSGSFDNTIKCWDILTAREVRTLHGHSSVVTSVSLTPKGTYLLSGSWDKTVKCWDWETGQEIRTFTGHSKGITAVAVSPAGEFLYTGSEDHTIRCWELASGQLLRTFSGHNWKVTCLALTADGGYLLSGSRDDTVICWDTHSGEIVRRYKGHERTITSLAIGPESRFLLTGSLDHTVKCWDLETGVEVRTFKGHGSVVTGVAVTPDGHCMVSCSEDRTVKCWDVDTGKETHSPKFQGHEGGVSCVIPSLEGRFLFSGARDKTVKGWDPTTGREIITFKGHSRNITGLALTPENHFLLSGSLDHKIKCWEIASGKEVRTFSGHSGPVTCILLTPDARFLLSGSYDHMIKCWEVETGKEVRILKGHEGGITALSQTGDGRYLVSGSYDNTVRYWDFITGKLVRTFSGHHGGVTAVAISTDGKSIFSGAEDHTIKRWDITQGNAVRPDTLGSHAREVNCLTISRDGKSLFSASNDHDIKIWRVDTGECCQTIRLPWIVRDIQEFHQQPGLLATANDNCTITLFRLY